MEAVPAHSTERVVLELMLLIVTLTILQKGQRILEMNESFTHLKL